MSLIEKAKVVVTIVLFLAAAHAFAAAEPDNETGTAVSAKFDDWSVVGPGGGDVRVVTIDPRDKDRLYISTLDGQIYTSGDAGKTWRLVVNLNQPLLILDNLMVDSRDSKIIYASGHRHKDPGGFFRSTDGGVTWKEARELKNEAIQAMTQSEYDPNVLFVGTTTGAWRSNNSGGSWERLSSTTVPIDIDSMAVDPRNTSTIYAGTWWRAYKSTDSGKNWRLIKDGMIDDSDVFAIDIDPRNPEHIIASACSGIYESRNAGERWAKIQGIPSQSRRTRDIKQHPTKPEYIYAGTTEGFWMSANGGKSWSMTTQRNLEVNSIAVHPDAPNRVFIGTNNNGVMVSNDGGRSFAPTNGNFTSRFTYLISPDRQQSNRIYAATHNTATGGGSFFVSSDGGRSWSASSSFEVNRAVPFSFLQDRANPNLMYLGTNVGVYRSVDRGASWAPLPSAKPVVRTPARRPAARRPVRRTVAVSPTAESSAAFSKPVMGLSGNVKALIFTEDGRNGILAGTDKGLFRSYDISKGWNRISLGAGVNDNIFAIHISPTRPDTIWVGTATSGVLVSHDSGKTWSKAGGAVDSVPVSSIASDPKRPDYIYVGSSQTFYLSRNGGQTWRQRGGNLSLGNFKSILINPDNTDEILISSALETDGGLFISTDAGEKWKRVDTKDMRLPSRRIWAMAFDPHDTNRIFAGTHSAGVYRIERKAESAAADPKTPVSGN